MKTVQLDFISDYICPWCYLGKVRLHHIIESLQNEIDINITLKPYILYPHIPKGGLPKSHFVKNTKAGMGRSLRQEASIEGISFNYKLIDVIPNSMEAHRLTQLVQDQSVKYALAMSIFHAYFEEGQNIEDHKILHSLAKQNDIPDKIIETFASSEDGLEKCIDSIEATRSEYINVVPTLKFNNSFSLSGLQSTEVWENYIRRAAK